MVGVKHAIEALGKLASNDPSHRMMSSDKKENKLLEGFGEDSLR